MADNVAITAGSGTTVAADELTDGTLGSVKVQYMKLMDGTLDSSVKALVTASAPSGSDGALNVVLSPNSDLATLTTKSASTRPDATDVALVVALSPNSAAIATEGDDATTPANNTGALAMAVSNDTPEVRIPGLKYPLSVTVDGRLRVAAAPTTADVNFYDGFFQQDLFGDSDGPLSQDAWDKQPNLYGL